MPNSMNNDGISRKIGDIEERKKLKQILSSVEISKTNVSNCKNCWYWKTKRNL